MSDVAAPLDAGGRAFRRLGQGIVRRPWLPILLWVLLLLVSLPLLTQIGNATQNSATNLPSNAPSAQAANELARLFPDAGAPTASYLLLTGNDLTDPAGQNATLAVAAAVSEDRSLQDVASVSSLYSAYQAYLVGQANLTIGLGLRAPGPTAVPAELSGLVPALWGEPAEYFANWTVLVAEHPNSSADAWNYPALLAVTGGNVSRGGPALLAFYDGVAGRQGGFNSTGPVGGTGGCANDPATAGACADATARATGAIVAPSLDLPGSTQSAVVGAVLTYLGLGNLSDPAALGTATDVAVSGVLGVPLPWVERVASVLPTLEGPGASSATLPTWAVGIADGPVARYPLPIPASISQTFLSADGKAALVIVSYSISDNAIVNGHTPVFEDISAIDRVVPPALAAADPAGDVSYAQTGPAPLDLDESNVLAQNLAIVLPLTLVILVIITIAYFRAPLAPLVTFGGLGLAIGLGLAALVGITKIFGKVDPTSLTLMTTFVLGIGTDYSIFLVARYREELRRGGDPKESVVTAVTWAGQSVATSGSTAVLATLALAFSGVGLLSQWGEVLSVAVLLTVLVSLTLVPALLTLLGPRVFWPEVGARAERRRAEEQERWRSEKGYFFRAGRRVQRHPWRIILIILAVSVPLAYVAVVSPLGYDFYQQLPSGSPATDGLQQFSTHFGGGAGFPTQVLISFRSPLFNGTASNVTEMSDLAAATSLVNGTSGVDRVLSLVGPYGAPLAVWLTAPAEPVGVRADLDSTYAGYVGTDNRTVLMTVITRASGLGGAAVSVLNSMKSELVAFRGSHPDVTGVAYAGGAPVTSDLAAQTALATERMILAVSIGLLVVLFAVLRSVIIPPMAVATIGLSIGWAWGATQLLFVSALGLSLFFFVPTVLFVLILGLGIDYNIFLLTRVREERLRGRPSREAVREAVARTGGIITAAALILAGAFAALAAGDFLLLRTIGFSVALAVILDAMIVRTYLVPSILHLLGDRVWQLRRRPRPGPGVPQGGSPPGEPSP